MKEKKVDHKIIPIIGSLLILVAISGCISAAVYREGGYCQLSGSTCAGSAPGSKTFSGTVSPVAAKGPNQPNAYYDTGQAFDYALSSCSGEYDCICGDSWCGKGSIHTGTLDCSVIETAYGPAFAYSVKEQCAADGALGGWGYLRITGINLVKAQEPPPVQEPPPPIGDSPVIGDSVNPPPIPPEGGTPITGAAVAPPRSIMDVIIEWFTRLFEGLGL